MGIAVVAVGLVGSLALSEVIGGGTVSARPGPSGYYFTDSIMDYGPNPQADENHVAYSGFNGPLTRFAGRSFITTNLWGGNWGPDPAESDPWVQLQIVEREISVSGITGATVAFETFNGSTATLRCESPDLPLDGCSIPAGEYSLVLEWEVTARSGPCMSEWRWGPPPEGDLDEECPRQTHEGTLVRRVIPGNPLTATTTAPLPEEPTAAFVATRSDDDPRTFTFDNRSTDSRDLFDELTFEWDFGDGNTSSEAHPTHRFERAGVYEVKLTVTDTDGNRDDATQVIEVANELVVNSTGDDPAIDPEDRGCDTGGTVGDDPECTLRAAIESAEVAGGGEITFDIDGAGTPEIAVGSPLPPISVALVVDGTSQTGGLVGVAGPSAAKGTRGILLTGSTSEVRGLVISGFEMAVRATGGTGHVIEGNRLGVDVAGTGAREVGAAVTIEASPGVEVRDNLIAGAAGIIVGPGSGGAKVEGNTIGATLAGAALGDPETAIVTISSDTEILDNHVRAADAGVLVLGPDASGATVSGNTAVVNHADDLTPGYAIRIDGAPDATVTGNDVTGGRSRPGISVTGSVQSGSQDDGTFVILPPGNVVEGPVTGGRVTIGGNDIVGTVVDGVNASGTGVQSWAGASNVDVGGNTIVDVRTGVSLEGGDGHRIVDNTIGSKHVQDGIEVTDATDVTIGEPSGPNVIEASSHGIDVDGASTGASIVANEVTGADSGIQVRSQASGAVVAGNVVRSAIDAVIVNGDEAAVTDNVLSESERAVVSRGEGARITGNRIGLAPTGSEVLGNKTAGVAIVGGDAVIERNTIAGSGADGVDVSGGVASLRANRIFDSGGKPISTETGPGAPSLLAAIRTTSGTSTRTTLVLDDLPGEAGGRLEVFADDSCDGETGGEARYVLDLNRTTRAREEARIIQIQGLATRRFFTVTYTDADDGTSELSACVEARTYPDSDGDGSPDPLDGLLDLEDDPSSAIIATDSEELLVLAARSADLGEGGNPPPPPAPLALSEVAVIDDPDPGGHPGGFTLPYGVLTFRVQLAKPGGRASLILSTMLADSLPAGAAYWKYGPPTTGAPERWYDFAYDDATGTGARIETMDLPTGIGRSFLLMFHDGARGDRDGAGNGTVTDPGGITVGAPTGTTPPPAPTTTAPEAQPAVPTTVAPDAAPPTGQAAATGELPRTGSDLATLIQLAGLALAIGGALVLAERRRRLTSSRVRGLRSRPAGMR